MNIMNSKPLGKDFTTEDTISHVKETTGIDLDKDFKKLSEVKHDENKDTTD